MSLRECPLKKSYPALKVNRASAKNRYIRAKQVVSSAVLLKDRVPNEGDVIFDILFYAKAPGKPSVKVYINIEAQKDFYPGYDLVTRAVFYCARLLSKQLGVEFTPKDYDGIKKVYSIWVCINAPQELQNTISSYQMSTT